MVISTSLFYTYVFVLFLAIDAFKSDQVSETILRRLLKQDIIHHIKIRNKEKNDDGMVIYEEGKPVGIRMENKCFLEVIVRHFVKFCNSNFNSQYYRLCSYFTSYFYLFITINCIEK